jgi:hypothetical protein
MPTVASAPIPVANHRTLSSAGPLPWKWTQEEFVRLHELGLFGGQRVMLIDGEVLALSPMNEPHARGIVFSIRELEGAFGANVTIRPQMPMDLGQNTDPEPGHRGH